MLAGTVHAFLPHSAFRIDCAELAREDAVEVFNVIFRPLDAGRHHRGREAGLVRQDCVSDDGEVDEGELVNVLVEVAVEDALSVKFSK